MISSFIDADKYTKIHIKSVCRIQYSILSQARYSNQFRNVSNCLFVGGFFVYILLIWHNVLNIFLFFLFCSLCVLCMCDRFAIVHFIFGVCDIYYYVNLNWPVIGIARYACCTLCLLFVLPQSHIKNKMILAFFRSFVRSSASKAMALNSFYHKEFAHKTLYRCRCLFFFSFFLCLVFGWFILFALHSAFAHSWFVQRKFHVIE